MSLNLISSQSLTVFIYLHEKRDNTRAARYDRFTIRIAITSSTPLCFPVLHGSTLVSCNVQYRHPGAGPIARL